MNWIAYLERYSQDKLLLDSVEEEIVRMENDGRRSKRLEMLRASASVLRYSVRNAEELLESYVYSSVSESDARKRAREKLFLELRYKNGMTIEQAADAMHVSRDTAYRIRRNVISRGDIF